jgi:charged multivesicular body protein 1
MTLTMDNFEKQFENLDLLDKCFDGYLDGALTTGGATAEVDALMSKVAAENDLQEQLAIMKAPEAKKS